MFSGDAFVPEVAADLEDLVKPAYEQTLQIKLWRDAQIQIEAERLVMGVKRFGRGAAGNGLQNRRLHFQKAALLKEAPGFTDNRDPLFEHEAGTLVRKKIEITLSVADLDGLQPVPFFRQRPQSFREHPEGAHLDRRFPAFREKACALDADEIPDIEQAKKIDQLSANFFRVNINLNPSGGVAQVEKVAFAHVAMRSDAASRAKGLAFFKFFAHLRDRSAWFETSPEWFDPFRAKRVEFFAPQRDQLILFVHRRRANVKRRAEMNSLKEAGKRYRVIKLQKLKRCNDVTFNELRSHWVCQGKTDNEIVAGALRRFFIGAVPLTCLSIYRKQLRRWEGRW